MEDPKAKVLTNNICCLGVSYVGVPVSTVMAHMCPSLNIAVVDLNPEKITLWNTKQIPTREPGLEEMLKKCLNRNLVFTPDVENAIRAADIVFLSISSPMHVNSCGDEASPDLSELEKATRLIANASDTDKIIVQKNTVPSGSSEIVLRILEENKNKSVDFQILTIPEFFSAGNAIETLLKPDRIVIGTDGTPKGQRALNTIVSIYSQWVPQEKIITISNCSAELAKLGANALLAQRLSSVNAMSLICEASGADLTNVITAVGRSSAIGTEYLEPSISFGGTHLKNDLLCLIYMCERYNLPETAEYWKQVLLMNEHRRKNFEKKILTSFFHTLTHKKIAIWGVAFKRNVDIAKDSSAIEMCRTLLVEGAKLKVYDPKVEKRQLVEELTALGIENCEKSMSYYDDPYKAASKAHAIVVCTDCEEFKNIDYSLIFKEMMRPAYIFDGRKCLQHEELTKIGFIVRTIGKKFNQSYEKTEFL